MMSEPNDEMLKQCHILMQTVDKILKIKNALRQDIVEQFIPVNEALINFSHYMSHYCDKAPADEE